MVVALLNIYHAYWIFASIVVGFALGVNLLLSWFIEWFQYSAAAATTNDTLEVLEILWQYVAVFLRSCLLIKLLSHLMRVALWLLRDALRLEAFQVYRCIICGGAVKEYLKGNADAIRTLGDADKGWTYYSRWTACWDILAQFAIYFTFDGLPVLMGARTFFMTKDVGQAGTQFAIYACGVAIGHVLTFHFAEMMNDLAAKVIAWNQTSFKAARRRLRASDPGIERNDSDTPVPLASPVHHESSGSVGATDSIRRIEFEDSDDEEDSLVELRRPGAPWNACVLLCSLLEAILVLSVSTAIVAALFFLGIVRWIDKKDPLVIIFASVLGLVILCYLGRKLPRRCSRKFAAHAPKRPPRQWGQRWSNFWKWANDVQRWGDLHCGFAESVAAPQYELFALILLLQGALFVSIKWWEGVWLMSFIFALVALRRLTLGVVRPFGWMISLLEALVSTIMAVAFNGIYFDSWYAIGTFGMVLAVQFSVSRQHLKTWRVLLWMTLALQVSLVIIVSISMLAVTQDQDHFSNFCEQDDWPGCQYFSTKELPVKSFAQNYPFCDMAFPMYESESRNHDANHGFHEGLSLAQFAMFSSLTYESNNTLERSLGRWFPKWNLVHQRRIDHVTEPTELHQDWTTFFEFGSPDNKTSVFAVRGTHLPLEILQDINIWAPIAIPQFASFFGPDLTSVAAQAVLVLSTLLYGEYMQKKYYSELLRYVKTRIHEEKQRRFYITGHSLGGGLAQLVSMETDVPAITFSAPGVAATRLLISDNQTLQKKAAEHLHRLSYSVVPDNDLVPQVDKQLGTQIRVGCNLSPLGCHSVGETMCDLLLYCGHSNHTGAVDVRCDLCPSHRHHFKGCKARKTHDAQAVQLSTASVFHV